MLEKREFDNNDFAWRLSAAITVVAGLFSFVVFMLIVINYLQIRAADPINNELITKMRQDYAALPQQSEVLAERIRNLDLLTRKAFFTSQEHLRIGAILLLVGVSIFLVAFKYMMRWGRERPDLAETPTAEKEFLAYAESRQLITWGGVGLLAVGLLASYLSESLLGPLGAIVGETVAEASSIPEPAAEDPAEVVQEFPTWDTMKLNWPAFRGPGGSGTAYYDNAPTDWDVESGQGIRWKVEVPLAGANSPVVWGERLFLTGATDEVREVYCYDTETGELLWQRKLAALPGTPAGSLQVNEETGHAAPTMAVHGGQAFAMFANGDLVSYDFEGNQIWGRNLGLPENHYGHSSSLLAYEGLLFVQLDQSEEAKLLALEVGTGKESWVGEREHISWASPILAHTPQGLQLILASEEDVDAYDPLSGKLLWSQACLSGEVAPSPAYSNGLVLVANEYAIAAAIEISGSEGAVESKIVWDWDELLPEVSSPVGDGERFYMATSMGDIVSLDAKTGEEAWIQEMDEGFYSSPILVGDRIYILDIEGTMQIFGASAEYKLIASPSMGDRTFATPAFLDGRIYVRTEKYLYCIE